MKAYAALHTAKPSSQSEHEVSYPGYGRVAVEFGEDFGEGTIDVQFPEILGEVPGKITHISIGSSVASDGDLLLVIASMPHIAMLPGLAPRIGITNIVADKNGNPAGAGLPVRVHPIARVVHALVMNGELQAEDLHPKLYEAVNDELAAKGIPVIPVKRAGRADMVQTLGWGLSDLGIENPH